MTTIRKIVTSQVDGNDANSTNDNEIRPYGETSFYVDINNAGKLVLSMFDGQRTHLKSKVVGPGVLYGSNADSGDGYGFDTIKLIPDAGLHYNDGSYGNDQYLIIDPTSPNHIHIRAGGTQDASTAELFLGGELTNVKVSDSSDSVTIRTSDTSGGSAIPKEWIFDNTGKLSFPIFGAIETVGMGWFGITNGESGGPISIVQKSINVAHTGQYLSDITLSNGNDWTTGDVRISTSDLTAETSHQWIFGADGEITMGDGVTIDTEGIASQGDFNLTLPGTNSLTPQQFKFTDEGGEGAIRFPNGTYTIGNQISAPTDDTIKLKTFYRPTISAEAISGSSQDLLVVDISANDDITVLDANWEINAGSEVAPQWLPVVSTDIVPGDICSINVPGFDFIAGFTYTFRNSSPTVYDWTFNPAGTLTAPGGAILSSETAAISNNFITYNNTSTERPVSVYWESNSEQPTLRYLHLGVTSDTAMPLYAAALEIKGQIEPYGMIGGRIIRFTDTSGTIYSLTIPAYSNISAQTSITALGGEPGISWLIQEGSWGVTGAPTDDTVINIVSPSYGDLDTTYRDFAIELPSQDGTNEFRWEFDNSGDMIAPGAITIAGTLNTPLGSVVGIAIDTDTFVGLQGDTGSGVIIRATDDELNFIDWKFGIDGGLTTPYGLQISDQYIQHPATGNFISLNNDTGVDVMSNGVLQLVSNFGAADPADRRYWQLNTNGSITFPDDTVQTTAWAGGRVVSVPTHSTGAAGDTEGDLAFSNGYIYYCTADYGQVGHQVTVATDYSGATVLNTNNIKLTKTADTLQITVGDVISDSDGGATSVVGIVSHDENFTYVGTGPGGSVAYSCVFPLTFTSTDYVSGGNIWKRVAWSGDTW